MAERTVASAATSAWVVIAPMTSASPSILMPFNSATPDRSTRSVGWANRCFKVGIRVWPPATTVASSLLASSDAASSPEDGL